MCVDAPVPAEEALTPFSAKTSCPSRNEDCASESQGMLWGAWGRSLLLVGAGARGGRREETAPRPGPWPHVVGALTGGI